MRKEKNILLQSTEIKRKIINDYIFKGTLAICTYILLETLDLCKIFVISQIIRVDAIQFISVQEVGFLLLLSFYFYIDKSKFYFLNYLLTQAK